MKVYPNLSWMARNYLSIPGKHVTSRVWIGIHCGTQATSTSVERVFSKGRQLLSFMRNSLSGAAVRAYLCLGSWCRNDLITIKDIASDIASRRGARHTREVLQASLGTETSDDA